jgi:hypothetical protein
MLGFVGIWGFRSMCFIIIHGEVCFARGPDLYHFWLCLLSAENLFGLLKCVGFGLLKWIGSMWFVLFTTLYAVGLDCN